MVLSAVIGFQVIRGVCMWVYDIIWDLVPPPWASVAYIMGCGAQLQWETVPAAGVCRAWKAHSRWPCRGARVQASPALCSLPPAVLGTQLNTPRRAHLVDGTALQARLCAFLSSPLLILFCPSPRSWPQHLNTKEAFILGKGGWGVQCPFTTSICHKLPLTAGCRCLR